VPVDAVPGVALAPHAGSAALPVDGRACLVAGVLLDADHGAVPGRVGDATDAVEHVALPVDAAVELRRAGRVATHDRIVLIGGHNASTLVAENG
jgi:hypothetical protein